MVGCWPDGWLENIELKPTQPSWSWSWAELGNVRIMLNSNISDFEGQILIFIQKIKMVPEAREEGGMREAPKPLYGRMMKAIRSGHTFGNRVRMLKVRLS